MSSDFRLAYWQRMVILLCFGWVAIWMYRTTLTPLYGEMRTSLGVTSDAGVGAIASIYFLSYTALQIPAGFLMDRFGPKTMLLPGFALFAAAAAIIGSASGIETVYLGSLLAGIGTGVYYGSAYSLVGQAIPPANRTFSTAIINSGSAIGMGLGLIGSSWLVKNMGLPWNSALYTVCAVILLALLCFALFIKSPGRDATPTTAEARAEQDISGTTALFSLHSIATYILTFSICYGYYMMVSWLPNFLETERGFQGVAVGMTASLLGFAAIPGALGISRVADRFRHWRLRLIVGLSLCSTLTFTLIVTAQTPGLLLTGLLLYGLTGKLAVEPMLLAHVIEGAPRRKMGTYLSVLNFFGMASAVVAPLVTGMISDLFHSKVGGFYVSIGVLLVSVALFQIVNHRSKRARQPHEG